MRHLSRDAQLVVELCETGFVRSDALVQELQRDRLIEGEVVGSIDLAHAAAAEQGDQAIAAGDNGTGRETAA